DATGADLVDEPATTGTNYSISITDTLPFKFEETLAEIYRVSSINLAGTMDVALTVSGTTDGPGVVFQEGNYGVRFVISTPWTRSIQLDDGFHANDVEEQGTLADTWDKTGNDTSGSYAMTHDSTATSSWTESSLDELGTLGFNANSDLNTGLVDREDTTT